MVMLLVLLVSSLCLGNVLGAAQSPWPTPDNDYYYDSLAPPNTLPVITSKSQQLLVNQGGAVVLPCDVNNLGEYSLVWRRGGQILWLLQEKPEGPLVQAVTRDDRLRLNGTGLSLQDARPGDEGTYTCELSTSPLTTVNHTLSLRVPPDVYPDNNRSVVTVKMGDSVNLACHAAGSPAPNLSWSVKGRKLTRPTSGNKLLVSNARPEDNGEYTCIADNGATSNASTTISLLVMYPPKVRPDQEEVFTGVSYSTTLACYVEAVPRAKVRWFKVGDIPVDPLRLAKSVDANNRYSLQFPVVTLEDFGVYSCNATNYMGNASATLTLTGRPSPVRYFSSPHGDDNTTYTLVWDVESYAPVLTFTVTYGNESDPVEQWINFTVPSSSSSSTLYVSSHTFENLTPGASYSVHVTATNEFGESDVNETFVFSTLQPEAVTEPEVAPPEVSPTQSAPTPRERQPPQQASPSPPIIRDGAVTAESSSSPQDTSAAPTLSPQERRIQMGAFLTAIILSCFF